MAIESNIIKIKRSGTSGAPASLKLGELAYSYLTASGNPTSNGGDRLFIGANGVNGGTGNANDVIVIGGKYFTDLLDHERGILTASSALVVDANKKLDELLVDNLSFNGNSIITTDVNGDLTLAPNGTGSVLLTSSKVSTSTSTGALVVTGGVGIGGALFVSGTISAGAASFTSINNTPIGNVTPSTGAFTALTVDNISIDGNAITSTDTNGNITVTPNGTGKTIIANIYTDATTSLLEYIQDATGGQVVAGEGIDVTYDDTAGTVTVSGEDATSANKGIASFSPTYFTVTAGDVAINDATSSTKGIASFNSTDFTVTTGAVTVNAERIEDIVGAMVSTNTESNISVTYDDPNGKLDFSVNTATSSVLGVASFDSTDFTVTTGAVTVNAERVQDIVGGMIDSNTESGISVTYDDTNGKLDFNVNDPVITIAGDVDGFATMTNLGDTTITVTLDTVNTTVGTFGSTTSIPVVTVNGKGLVTSVTTASISTTLNIAGTTGTDAVALGSDTLTFAGTGAISTAVTDNQVAISVATATSSVKGVATFNTGGFVVTSGDVALKADVAQSVTGDTGTATPAINSFKVAGTSAQGIVTSATGSTVTVTASDATSSQKGVATFNTASFTVTAADVTIKSGGVTNSQLVNSSVTVGSTSISLGATSTTLAGLTQVDVNNIRISGNTISSTNTNGGITLDPNGTGHISASSALIKDVATPVDPTDAANKAYVDAVAEGLHIHASVMAATIEPIAGSVAYDNGDEGVGATLTTDTPMTLMDGYSLVNTNRVLIKNQANAAHNGIYVRTSSTVFTRATDFNTTTEVASGDFLFVSNGTVNGKTGWVQTVKSIAIGTTNVVFEQFSGAGTYIAGSGLAFTGNTIDIVLQTQGGLEISSDELGLKSTVAGGGLTYTNGVIAVGGTADRITVSADAIDISTSYVGQNTITTLGTVTTGTWQANVITYAYGGTGQSSYAKGDLLYASAANTLSKLTAGTNGQTLQLQEGLPVWADLDGGTY